MSVPCSPVTTSWERADLLTLLCLWFLVRFATSPYGAPGQVWYFMVMIPEWFMPSSSFIVCFATFQYGVSGQVR